MDADPHEGVRRLAPLVLRLRLTQEVERWLEEQPTTLLDEPWLRPYVAIVERFDDLLRSVAWVAKALQRDGGPELSRQEQEVAVTIAAFRAAASQAAPSVEHDWRQPALVLLSAWRADLVHQDEVNAPQIAAACMGGGWTPPWAPDLTSPWWEPAGLALEAMTYKSVHRGLHVMATKNVPPLARERCRCREQFTGHVTRATHLITAWLASGRGCGHGRFASISQWRCEERSLWEFIANAVLGPGRAGAASCGRPVPGAFAASLLGRWCEQTLGVRVGTIEVYVCLECQELCAKPACPRHPSGMVIATSCRNHFVTPRCQLEEEDQEWGHVQVVRTTCNNPRCVERLRAGLHGHHQTARPIYPLDASECPSCHTTITGQRPVTVWTRHP